MAVPIDHGKGLKAEQVPTWRERFAALRNVPPLLKLVWQTHRGYTATMALLRFVRAFVPVAALWIGKLIIDAVVSARMSQSPDFSKLWELVGMEILVVLTGELLVRASALVESLLGDLFSNHTSVRLMEHAAILDL